MTKRLSKALLIITIASQSLTAWARYEDDSKYLKVAGAIGGAVIGGYAISKFFDWAFSPSDQTVLERARNSYNQACRDYANLAVSFQNPNQGHGILENYVHDDAEPVLYELATLIHREQRQAVACIDNMNHTLKQLSSQRKELCKRIAYLAKNPGDEERYYLCRSMEILVQDIESFASKLERLYNYVELHRGYFVLYEKEAILWSKYSRAIDTLKLYNFDRPRLEYYIKAEVMMHQAQQNLSYPYLEYVKMLKHDLQGLDSAITKVSYAYHARLNAARDLYATINSIQALLVATSEYRQELRAYEKEQLELAKLEVERQKAEAARLQAQAERWHVLELERHNRILEKELREKEREREREKERVQLDELGFEVDITWYK